MLNQIDLSRVDLNLLALFETVLREGHVGRAAERMSLSPSAVSHGLGRLRRLLNDPLFLKHPKGVVPTARALELAPAIGEALERVRGVIAAAEPFQPASSKRRFLIGGADGMLAMVVPPLIARVAREAPGVDLGLRMVMPQDVTATLDARLADVALTPADALPARFAMRRLYHDRWVIALRAGHPLAMRLDLDAYCEARHMVVSLIGDPLANIDLALQEIGRRRRVTLTVPNLVMGLALAGESDLLVAAPAGLVAVYATRYRLAWAEPPLPLPGFDISATAPAAALADAGVAWLLETLESALAA
jgi:DNA-binding transcriptional LysR family regulator